MIMLHIMFPSLKIQEWSDRAGKKATNVFKIFPAPTDHPWVSEDNIFPVSFLQKSEIFGKVSSFTHILCMVHFRFLCKAVIAHIIFFNQAWENWSIGMSWGEIEGFTPQAWDSSLSMRLGRYILVQPSQIQTLSYLNYTRQQCPKQSDFCLCVLDLHTPLLISVRNQGFARALKDLESPWISK